MSFTDPVFVLLHLAGFAFLISLAVSGFMISAGLLDKPVERSNHSEDIPTAGGVGIIAGVGAGLLALSMYYPSFANQTHLGALAAILLAVGFVGLIDDIYDTNASIKFIVLTVLSTMAVVTIGAPTAFPFSVLELTLPYWVAFSGSVLWIFVLTNGVNFMDGANGLMGSFMAVALLFLTLIAITVGASNTAVFSTLLGAAVLGFLPYNWKKRAHIFCGDVGALFVGFGYAIAVLLLVKESGSSELLFIGPLLVLPFLTDILMTMLARARRRENLMAAHSSHIYQRMIEKGLEHRTVSLLYMVGAIVAGVTTLLATKTGLHRSFFFLGFAICSWVLVYLVLHQKLPKTNGRGPQQK